MTQSLSELSNTARQLATWLGAWRILVMLLAVLGVIGSFLGIKEISQLDDSDAVKGFLFLLPLPVALCAALFTWINWRLIGWGKDWVEQATAAAEQGGAAYSLVETRGNLDRWLSFIIWGTLAFMVLAFLLLIGVFAVLDVVASITYPTVDSDLSLVGVIFFLIFAVTFLLFTYLPLTALRTFLGDATARLQGVPQAIMPAAKRLNIWLWLLIVLQVGSVLFNLPTSSVGKDSLILGPGFLGLLFLGAIAALYIVPLLLTGKFAKLLAERLDIAGGQMVTPTAAQTAAPPRDYSNMGRVADQVDERQGR